MNALIKRVAEAVKDPFRTILRESPARTRGDQARDAGRISEAADAYREHLKEHVRDFPIWVQLGHMLKDSKRLAEADFAYGRALALRPNDVDVLLHAGSLKRAMDKRAEAAELFARCAEIELSPSLIAEMTAHDMDEFLSYDHRRMFSAEGARAVADAVDGVVATASSGMIGLGDNRVRFVTDDPWLVLVLPKATRGERLSGLRLKITGDDPHRRPNGRIYIDYGDGFDPNDSFAVTPPDGEHAMDVTVFLAAPDLIKGVRWDPDDKTNEAMIETIAFVASLDLDAAFERVRNDYPAEIDISDDVTRYRKLLAQDRIRAKDAHAITRFLNSGLRTDALSYDFWRRRWIDPNPSDYERIAEMTAEFTVRPTFSFVMPTYNTPITLLIECLESLLNQTYQDFEICIADDRSPDPRVFETLQRYARRDPRIKIVRREHNGHISAASNSALAMATGEFVVLVDHDDLIPDYTLFVVAHYINQNPQAQVLFSDEDKVSVSGERFQPYFKGTFDPYLMYGHNMVSHLGVYRRDLVEKIGGFRLGLEGSQDYDLLLRAWEAVGADAIVHIPHVLYHWRAIPGSTAVSADQKSYAIIAAGSAINGHFERTGAGLRSSEGFAPGCSGIVPTREARTLVSIIIPSRDHGDILQACIDSIAKANSHDTEIIVIDNGSQDPPTVAYLAELEASRTAKVIRHDAPFNFSEINNIGAQHAAGDILCFLNNDTEVVSADWLTRAHALLDMPGVGMVGARLLYPDGTLQHFGLITGMAAHKVAGAPHLGNAANDPGYFGKARLMQQFGAVTAACMFVRAEVFSQVGGFDPELKVAYNDVDLCLKVRQAGFKIVGDPDITLIHKESKSRGSDVGGEKAVRLASEAQLMRDRWAEMLDNDPFYSPNLSLERGDFVPANPPRVPMPWRIDRPRIRVEAPARVAPVPPPPPWVELPPPPIGPISRFDDLPAEVSPEVLRRRYHDLVDFDDATLVKHFEEFGRPEGRQASDVAVRENFLQMIDRDASILEIGPYFSPQFHGPNVKYLDVFDAETLRTHAVSAGADPEGCPTEIHYTNGLAEAAGANFDVVFSSHAIEHQPDLIGHLTDVAAALKPGGLYWIVCPDKRYCFDHKRQASTIADVLDAKGRTRNTRRAVIDQVVLSDHNDPVRHWRGEHDDVAVHERERLRWALDHLEERGDDYIDVHAWHLTPETFRKILKTLSDLQMIPLTRYRVYDTPLNRNEFMAVLGRND